MLTLILGTRYLDKIYKKLEEVHPSLGYAIAGLELLVLVFMGFSIIATFALAYHTINKLSYDYPWYFFIGAFLGIAWLIRMIFRQWWAGAEKIGEIDRLKEENKELQERLSKYEVN